MDMSKSLYGVSLVDLPKSQAMITVPPAQTLPRTRLFVSWTPHPRAVAIAEALGASLYCPQPSSKTWPAPLRWLVKSVRTVWYVGRYRPDDIIFTNPPFIAGVVLLALARITGARVWSDSHSASFNDPFWRRFERANSWVMRRCAGVIVTNQPLAEFVRFKGGRPYILNMVASHPRRPSAGGRQTLLAPFSYAPDEPVQEVLEAAAMAPEIHLTITGRAPESIVRTAPENCTFTGWLSRSDYELLLSQVSGVLCLTTRENTMQMCAFEALEFGVPVLASGTEVLRDYLDQGGVVFADDHSPGTLAACMQRLWRDHDQFMADALVAQIAMFDRAQLELATLEAALSRPRYPHRQASIRGADH
jgi:glycosyltransferase involved in cell wall biosynthesis